MRRCTCSGRSAGDAPSGRRPALRRLLGAAAGRAGAGRPRRRRRAAVLLGHHRAVEGRDAHPPQSGRQRRAGSRSRPTCARTTTFIAVLPFFHIYGMQVLMNTGLRGRRHRRHHAPLRPRAVPARCTRSTASPARSSRRRSWWRWPSTRWSTARPLGARAGLLGRGPAVGRTRARVRRSASAARSCRATA